MLKQTSIPSTYLKQKVFLLQGIIPFFCLLLISAISFRFITIISYPNEWSRIPEYDSTGIFTITLVCFLTFYSGKYLLNHKVYHFKLHPDILIIKSKTLFYQKIYFFDPLEIKTVSIQREPRYFMGQQFMKVDYEVIILTIQSNDQATKKYTLSPDHYELKALKKLFKTFL